MKRKDNIKKQDCIIVCAAIKISVDVDLKNS